MLQGQLGGCLLPAIAATQVACECPGRRLLNGCARGGWGWVGPGDEE